MLPGLDVVVVVVVVIVVVVFEVVGFACRGARCDRPVLFADGELNKKFGVTARFSYLFSLPCVGFRFWAFRELGVLGVLDAPMFCARGGDAKLISFDIEARSVA